MSLAESFARLPSVPDLDAALLAELRGWIETAPDRDLFRINLVSWSGAWGVDLSTAVGHFLHLTKAGVMDMMWDIHCPQCNVVLARDPALQRVCAIHSCKFCLKDVESRFDDHFEVTFTVNAGVREVGGSVRYEPSANVEVYLKEKFAGGSSRALDVDIPDHARNLRFVSWPPLAVRVIPTGRALADPAMEFYGGTDGLFPESVPCGAARLSVKNRHRDEINLMVENHDMREYEPHERSPRLTGLQVAMSPAFRALFGGETLSERESLNVRTATLAFSDIKGSTLMYQRMGDARAYNLVRDHFDILFDAIFHAGGTVVKTIGDSVMASFLLPRDAVSALLDAQDRFREFNSRRAAADGVFIRAGIHTGPAVVVTLNDRLDFFGTTVNEAARMEGTCDANEIVISESVLSAAGVADLLKSRKVEPFTAALKGLKESYRLHRVRPFA